MPRREGKSEKESEGGGDEEGSSFDVQDFFASLLSFLRFFALNFVSSLLCFRFKFFGSLRAVTALHEGGLPQLCAVACVHHALT